MGNSLCGHEPGATADPVTAAAQAAVFASGSVQHSAVAAEIEVTMTKARAEVDKSWQRRFCDEYEAGQVVGHGAFSKVQACTHRQTGAQFAVKVVEKVADSLKQREGKWCRSPSACAVHLTLHTQLFLMNASQAIC